MLRSSPCASDSYICAWEIQIGLADELKRLRSDHVAYECERILDALPLLRSFKEGKCGSGAAADLDYRGMGVALFKQAFPVVDRSKTIFVDSKEEQGVVAERALASQNAENCDKLLWVPGKGDPITGDRVHCINDTTFDAWLGICHHHQHHSHLKLWEMDLPKDEVQNVESCFVSIRDQGFGNEGLIVGLAMKLGPHIVLLSTRSFDKMEREEVRKPGPDGHAGGVGFERSES